MKKYKIKILIIIVIMLIQLSLYFVAGTYSKYKSGAESETKTKIAKWTVKLGNVDLANGEKDFSSELVLETINPEKVKAGTIAPNTTVQGSFTRDPNGTEVAMKYKITLGKIIYKNISSQEEITENMPNIIVSNVTSNVGTLTKNDDSSYNGTIDLAGSPVVITIVAEWIGTDDKIDTLNGYSPAIVTIPVNVTVEQDT